MFGPHHTLSLINFAPGLPTVLLLSRRHKVLAVLLCLFFCMGALFIPVMAVPSADILVSALKPCDKFFTCKKQGKLAIVMLNSSPADQLYSSPLETNITWIPIPDWLAGTWKAASELIVEAYDYQQHLRSNDCPRRIKIKRFSVLGTKKDKNGQIWHNATTPYQKIIDVGRYTEYQ